MVGRKSHLSPACTLLYGETNRDKTFSEPDIFRISTSQQRMYAVLKVTHCHMRQCTLDP
jgi:hypothetical protein